MPTTEPSRPPTGRPTLELLAPLALDSETPSDQYAAMRPADIADALNNLSAGDAARVLAALPFDLATRVFDEPELKPSRDGIIQQMRDRSVGPLIDAMSSDQQADLFRELPEADRTRLLALVSDETRQSMTLLLQYPPETAGGIMTIEFVSMPVTWTVEHALEYVNQVARTKETVYAIYLTDPATHKLVKPVSLRDLVGAEPNALVGDVGQVRPALRVKPLTDREEVARLVSKYDLLAIPVVDEGDHILGIVTVDDIIDAIAVEHTEDVQKFGGMESIDAPYNTIGFTEMIKKRAGWLCVLFLSEMFTATAMQHFEPEIEKAVMLSMFIPLVMSSGGNSGSQATSLIIRALALRELSVRDWWRVALRELPTGIALGAILGVIGFARIEAWQHMHLYDYGQYHTLLAFAVGLALVGIVGFGSLAGSMLPFILRRLGFDPASASAPFVATLVDVTGLVIYFSIAFLVLRGTLL